MTLLLNKSFILGVRVQSSGMIPPERFNSLKWFVNQLFVFLRVFLYLRLPVKTVRGIFALLKIRRHFSTFSSAHAEKRELADTERTVSRTDEG